MVIFIISIFKLIFSHYFFAKLFVSRGDQTEYGHVSRATSCLSPPPQLNAQ